MDKNMASLLKLGLLMQEAAKNAASAENRDLLVQMYRRVDEKATEELESLRLSMKDMHPARATELALLLAKAGA